MRRKKIVAANWKMHGSIASNAAWLSAVAQADHDFDLVESVVFPPLPYLQQVQQAKVPGLNWGAQNISQHGQGAFTGEVSAEMVREMGCQYVLVGHSERRAMYGETDEVVAAKFCAAQKSGLIPMLCLGETLLERDAGQTLEVVGRQLQAVLTVAGVASLAKAVLAYEPVWAIGTGRTASPVQAQEVHAAIRLRVAAQSHSVADGLRILYGGSVKPDNASAIFAMPDIDGGLVGGASLQAADFLSICRSACLG